MQAAQCTPASSPIRGPMPSPLPKNSGGGKKPRSRMGGWCRSPSEDMHIKTMWVFMGMSMKGDARGDRMRQAAPEHTQAARQHVHKKAASVIKTHSIH